MEKIKYLDRIKIPNYSLGEEIFNSITHGIGGGLSISALILMIIKAKGPMSIVATSLFGFTMILLYTLSCIYHSLSSRIKGKKST